MEHFWEMGRNSAAARRTQWGRQPPTVNANKISQMTRWWDHYFLILYNTASPASPAQPSPAQPRLRDLWALVTGGNQSFGSGPGGWCSHGHSLILRDCVLQMGCRLVSDVWQCQVWRVQCTERRHHLNLKLGYLSSKLSLTGLLRFLKLAILQY